MTAVFLSLDFPIPILIILGLLALGGVMAASVVGESADHSDTPKDGHGH